MAGKSYMVYSYRPGAPIVYFEFRIRIVRDRDGYWIPHWRRDGSQETHQGRKHYNEIDALYAAKKQINKLREATR